MNGKLATPNLTLRVLAPAGGSFLQNINGRTYQVEEGTVMDVPVQDAGLLLGNGWSCPNQQGGGAGPAAGRPTPGVHGGIYNRYYDTDLGLLILWDGAAWRDPATGNIV